MSKRLPISFVATLLFGCVCTSASIESPGLALAGGAASLEALADDLLRAVRTNDPAALDALRVSEAEYATIIAPGTVEVGKPPRQIDAATQHVFWRMLDAKSRDFGRLLLAEHGGKSLTRTAVELTRGVRTYAGYKAHGQLRVVAVDENGARVVLRSGTAAEVGGRFKLISSSWDD